jgi:hypothetical protein
VTKLEGADFLSKSSLAPPLDQTNLIAMTPTRLAGPYAIRHVLMAAAAIAIAATGAILTGCGNDNREQGSITIEPKKPRADSRVQHSSGPSKIAESEKTARPAGAHQQHGERSGGEDGGSRKASNQATRAESQHRSEGTAAPASTNPGASKQNEYGAEEQAQQGAATQGDTNPGASKNYGSAAEEQAQQGAAGRESATREASTGF